MSDTILHETAIGRVLLGRFLGTWHEHLERFLAASEVPDMSWNVPSLTAWTDSLMT